MSVLYFDTSALAKYYYPESGHKRVKKLVDNSGNDVVMSNLGIVEMSSALQTKIREGKITERTSKTILGIFIHDGRTRFTAYPIEKRILGQAIGLVQKYELRSLDSIHFATAREIYQNSSNFQLVSADQDMMDAAAAEGLPHLNPDP